MAQEATWPSMPWDRDNVVEGNDIHHIDGLMGDGGAVCELDGTSHFASFQRFLD